MLANGFVLRRLNGRLVAIDLRAAQSLRDIFAAAEQGDTGVGARGAAILLGSTTDAQFVGHVLPLTSGARRRRASYASVAAVFVRKIGLDLPHPVAAFADHYRLTPAELRVVTAIVNIGGVPEVAPVLGISETTVKTYLQRVSRRLALAGRPISSSWWLASVHWHELHGLPAFGTGRLFWDVRSYVGS